MTGRRHGPDGQASVELVAILPLALVVALAVAQLLAVGAAREAAGTAAAAGAAALLQAGDPVVEARAAMPAWSRREVRVAVHGRRVTVDVKPRALTGPLAALFAVRASADAGPQGGR